MFILNLLVLLAKLASWDHCTSFDLQVTDESSLWVGGERDNYSFDWIKIRTGLLGAVVFSYFCKHSSQI